MTTTPGMTISDHTKIMEFVISHASSLGFFDPQTHAPSLLLKASGLATAADMKLLLGNAAVETSDFLNDLVQIDPVKLEWERVRLVLAKIRLVEGDKQSLLATTKQLATKQKKGAIRTGLEASVDILEDGFATIYEPEFWVVHQAVMPIDVFTSNVKNAAKQVGAAVLDTATADAAGAVVGTVKGFVTGGQAGAAKGAVSGAVAGSVRGGVGPAE